MSLTRFGLVRSIGGLTRLFYSRTFDVRPFFRGTLNHSLTDKPSEPYSHLCLCANSEAPSEECKKTSINHPKITWEADPKLGGGEKLLLKLSRQLVLQGNGDEALGLTSRSGPVRSLRCEERE